MHCELMRNFLREQLRNEKIEMNEDAFDMLCSDFYCSHHFYSRADEYNRKKGIPYFSKTMARPSAEKIADIILRTRTVYGLDADSRIREAANRLTARALFEVLARLDEEAPGFPIQVEELMSAFSGEEVSTLIGFDTGDIPVADGEGEAAQPNDEPTVYYLRLVFCDEKVAYYQFPLFPPLDADYVLGAGRKREGAVQHLRLELAHPEAMQTFIEACRSKPHFVRVEESSAEEFELAPSQGV